MTERPNCRYYRAGCCQRVYNCPNGDANGSVEKEASMQVAAVQAAARKRPRVIQEYFDAWKGTDEDKFSLTIRMMW